MAVILSRSFHGEDGKSLFHAEPFNATTGQRTQSLRAEKLKSLQVSPPKSLSILAMSLVCLVYYNYIV
jgi:hypothetical protein